MLGHDVAYSICIKNLTTIALAIQAIWLVPTKI